MPLNLKTKTIENLKSADKPYKVSDGGGLSLRVSTAGSKTWVSAYRFQGKQKTLTIGNFPRISLKEARDAHNLARGILKEGRDPGAPPPEKEPPLTFGLLAQNFLKDFTSRVKPNTFAGVKRTLEIHLLPLLKDLETAKINPKDVSAILEDVKTANGPFAAAHVLTICRKVVSYGYSKGLGVEGFKDFTHGLAVKTPQTSGFSFLSSPDEIAAMLEAIDDYSERSLIVGKALKLLPLVFVRPNELATAMWHDVDLKGTLWTIPGEYMKMGRPHVVPLSRQAADIFKGLIPISGGGRYVFPALKRPGQHINPNSLMAALRLTGYTGAEQTAHGFRKTASTLLNEKGFNSDWIERQLAHVEGVKVRGVYNKALYLGERMEMMQWWADYLDSLKAGRPIWTLGRNEL
jgi:integrase